MASLLKSTYNTRFIIPGDYRYIRSDAPVNLTEDEAAWLLDKNIRTAIDLRTPEEQKQKPCPLMEREDFRYISLPVTGGFGIPSTPEDVIASYLEMYDEQMELILKTVLEADTGVICFCTAGKDRTGVVSALLMRHLGCSDEEIIANYMESKSNLEPLFRKFLASNPDISPEVITPSEGYMAEFLRRVRAR